ncbi:hypothetical protein JCM11641_006936 [Rhodosporidiobolus odoratus]
MSSPSSFLLLVSTRGVAWSMFPLLSLVALDTTLAAAQSCSNYATALSNGTCDCPVGFTGSDCSLLACSSPLEPLSTRTAFSTILSDDAGAGCGNQCQESFAGPSCTVCETDQACAAAASTSNAVNGLGSPVCSKGPWTWTQGFASCDVVNPTLQSVFAGSTTLLIQKTVEPSQSLSVTVGTNGTMLAQLFYSPSTSNSTATEQFYCAADSCLQSNSTIAGSDSTDWSCSNLKCTCIPGTLFCGAEGSPLDLTDTINGLTGTLEITCDALTGSQCSFKQDILKTLFGNGGLALSGCKWGECVLPSTIDSLATQLAGSVSGGSSSHDDLSGGVIAGLAVLGAIVIGLLSLLALGLASQRRARRQALAKEEALGGSPALGSSGASEKEKEGQETTPHPGIGMRWTNLSYSLPSLTPRRIISPLLPASKKPKGLDDGRLILSSLSATVQGGSFVSIFGPSGAGKSTLVDILAGVRKGGYTGGKVELLLPEAEGTDTVQKRDEGVRIGYVDQQDVLPETATVREAVMFAAELKMGEVPKERKRERVFTTLSQLGLLDVADSRIGSADTAGKRGISGGERRRVSIARELVAQPAVLILDEPTSGLDSSSALRILTSLKALTSPLPGQQPTTILLTIHQPSSQLFHMFDDVLLLAQGGEQLYFGRKDGVHEWFNSRGETCPSGWNPADFMLSLASLPSASPRPVPSASSLATARPPATLLPSIFSSNGDPKGSQNRKSSTTILTQVQVLTKRGMRELWRDRGLVLMHNIVPLVTGLIVGGMFYQVDLTIGGFQSRIGSLFFLGCLLSFSALSALSHFARAKSLFVRERARGYFHCLAWLVSTVVLDVLPLRIVPTILLGVIVYFMVGLAATAAHFFKFLLILLLFAIASTLWNFLLAAAITDTGVAILISSILNLFQLAYAGFFLNLSRIPPVLRWLQWLAPLKYCLEALAVNEVGAGLMIEDSLAGAKVQIGAEVIMETLFGFEMGAYYRDVLVLFGFICGFALLLVGTVLIRLRELR